MFSSHFSKDPKEIKALHNIKNELSKISIRRENQYLDEFPIQSFYEQYKRNFPGKLDYYLYIFKDPLRTDVSYDNFKDIIISKDIEIVKSYVYNDFMNTTMTIQISDKTSEDEAFIKYPIFFSGSTQSFIAESVKRLNDLSVNLIELEEKLQSMKIVFENIFKKFSLNLDSQLHNVTNKNYKAVFNKLRKYNLATINRIIRSKNITSINSLVKIITKQIDELVEISELKMRFSEIDELYLNKLKSILQKIISIVGDSAIYNNQTGLTYKQIISFYEKKFGQKLNMSQEKSNFNELYRLEERLISEKKNINKEYLARFKNKLEKKDSLIHNIKRSAGNEFLSKKREISVLLKTITGYKSAFKIVLDIKQKSIDKILKRISALRQKLGLSAILGDSLFNNKFTNYIKTSNIKPDNNKYIENIFRSNIAPTTPLIVNKNIVIVESNENKNIKSRRSTRINREKLLQNKDQIGYLLEYKGLFEDTISKLSDDDFNILFNDIFKITDIKSKYKYLFEKGIIPDRVYYYIKYEYLHKKSGFLKSVGFKSKVQTSPNQFSQPSRFRQNGGFVGLETVAFAFGSIVTIIMIAMNIFYKILNLYVKFLLSKCSGESVSTFDSIKAFISSQFKDYLITFLVFSIEFIFGTMFFFIPTSMIKIILRTYCDFIISVYKSTNQDKSKIYRIFESIYLSFGPYYYRYTKTQEYKNAQNAIKNVPYSKQIMSSINEFKKSTSYTISCLTKGKISLSNQAKLENIKIKNVRTNDLYPVYELIYDLGFLDGDEDNLIFKVKKILIEEIQENMLKLFGEIDWIKMVNKYIEYNQNLVNHNDQQRYLELASSGNYIKLLPLFKHVFFIKVLEKSPERNYSNKKIYGLIAVDTIFSKEVFINFNNSMEKKKNAKNAQNAQNMRNSKNNSDLEKSICDKLELGANPTDADANRKSNIQSFLQFLKEWSMKRMS